MRKKLNGFTLIELLAVILILGIISLIAVPQVNSIIEEVKKNSYISSARNIMKNVDIVEFNKGVDSNSGYKVYNLTNSDDLKKLNIKKFKVEYGYLTSTDNSKSILMYDNGYCVIGNSEEEINIYKDKSYCDSDNFIYNIEDLVKLSNDVKNGNSNKNIGYTLMKSLDFNDDSSYKNKDDKSFGDLNNNGVVETIKVELTTGEGFPMIGYYNSDTDNKPFSGNFIGLGYSIKNLYINKPNTEYIGLFAYIKNSNISNLNVNGKSIGKKAGIISGYADTSNIDNSSASGLADAKIISAGISAYAENSSYNKFKSTAKVKNSFEGLSEISLDFSAYYDESKFDHDDEDEEYWNNFDWDEYFDAQTRYYEDLEKLQNGYASSFGVGVGKNITIKNSSANSSTDVVKSKGLFDYDNCSGDDCDESSWYNKYWNYDVVRNFGGIISICNGDCLLDGNVVEGTINSKINVGGLVSNAYNIVIKNSKFKGSIQSNLYDASGIIAKSSGRTEISNSSVKGKIISNQYAGGVMAEYLGSNLKINNSDIDVVFDDLYSDYNGSFLGGVLGASEREAADIDIINSNVNVDMKADYRLGGVVGTYYGGNLNITGATVTGLLDMRAAAGGIIGISGCNNMLESNVESNAIIDDCVVNMTIDGGQEVAGIVGQTESNTLIKNSGVKGNITIRYFQSGSIAGVYKGSIYNTYSEANINIINSDPSDSFGNLGGMIGYYGAKGDNFSSTKAYNLYNAGSINIETAGINEVGSLIGQFGPDRLGSSTTKYIPLKNSYSISNISGTGSYIGLVARSIEGMENVYNGGQMSGTSNVGDITSYVPSNTQVNNAYTIKQNNTINIKKGIEVEKNLLNANFFKNTVKLGSAYQYSNDNYPLLYKINNDLNSYSSELVRGQTKIKIN